MQIGPGRSERRSGTRSFLKSCLILTLFLSSFISVTSQPGYAIPAFARKYGLPCSACHIGWPLLNNFGIAFRDNGYQLGNDKDSPIYQNPAYFPITFRVTPNWHLENTNKVAIDQTGTEQGVTTHGFDLSGLDIWTAGTLSKNISFQVLPSMGEGDTFHFESAFIRFDNLLNSPWLNVKFGKFELDNLLSEKRFLTLSGVGGAWFNYHFLPPLPTGPNGLDINGFGGIGDNQLGVELSGHNSNSYSRYSIALLSSVDGNPGLTTLAGGAPNTARTYDAYVNVNQGFAVKGLGVQRIGAYAYVGMSPTYFLTSGGDPVQAKGNRSFSRIGAYGWWFIKDLDVETFYMHGQDNVFLGNGVAANDPGSLPAGAVGPSWNGGFIEAHYTVNPQFIFTGRYELVHMSRQANPTLAATPNLGNVDSFTIGYRWYPIMLSRAGLALHNEYSQSRMGNLAPLTGTDLIQRSVMVGFDFDY